MSGLTEMLRRMGWTVPSGATVLNANACTRCRSEVLWVERAGRRMPVNRDGSRHPTNCSVGFGQVRRRESGHDRSLHACRHCPENGIRYPRRDLIEHVRRFHSHPDTP